jgi:uncharacterized membrane protein YidH (DUF202 family)
MRASSIGKDLTMNGPRILGFVLLAVGILLLIIGYNASQSVTEQAMETLTGRFTETTTWYFIGGVACTVGGLGLLAFGKGKK